MRLARPIRGVTGLTGAHGGLTDELPGALTITDPNGVTPVDGPNTTDLPQCKGTDYQRFEDLQIQTVRERREALLTTKTNEVHAMGLGTQDIGVREPQHHGSRQRHFPVDIGLASPDNLALDHENNLYIVKDPNGVIDSDA